MDSEAIPLFPVTIYRDMIEDFEECNSELLVFIAAQRNQSQGVLKTNRGGWHSEGNLHTLDNPHVEHIVRAMLKTVNQANQQLFANTPNIADQWDIDCWANVNDKTAYNVWHDHCTYRIPQSNVWSGVYYVKCDGGEKSGNIVFRDDFHGPEKGQWSPKPPKREMSFVPKVGHYFVFPSWLRHQVMPNISGESRVSMAFNFYQPGITIGVNPSYRRLPWAWKHFPNVMERLRRLSPVEL